VAATNEPDDRITAFGNQLIDMHIWLREELDRLREDVDGYLAGGGAGERPRELRAHCLTFCSLLTGHHTGEDDGVFPTIAEQFPALRPVLEELTRDHRLVADALRELERLVGGLGPVTDPAEARRIRSELDTLAALLETHFTYEEKKLVAALNALGTPAGGRWGGEHAFRRRA
jgi:iron-sulfur cluster repair protein YtfE (RIC family)